MGKKTNQTAKMPSRKLTTDRAINRFRPDAVPVPPPSEEAGGMTGQSMPAPKVPTAKKKKKGSKRA